MLKRSLMAGLAGATLLGALGLATIPAAAQTCLNPYAGAVPLSHDAMDPGAGFGYDKNFVDQQLAKGNRCANQAGPTTQQSAPVSPRLEYNRRANPNAFRSGGTYY
ncbi:MAG TPA: hypothetical protein VL418_05255 [Devosiaceae bacterium]|jgi:hypothetical protein|nr:hypothetical protein [Devosiaceae bacterium]